MFRYFWYSLNGISMLIYGVSGTTRWLDNIQSIYVLIKNLNWINNAPALIVQHDLHKKIKCLLIVYTSVGKFLFQNNKVIATLYNLIFLKRTRAVIKFSISPIWKNVRFMVLKQNQYNDIRHEQHLFTLFTKLCQVILYLTIFCSSIESILFI